MESNKGAQRRRPVVTRRSFLRTLVGAGVGYACFRYLPLLEASRISKEVQPPSTKKVKDTPQHPVSHHPVTHPVSVAFLGIQALSNAPTYTVTPTYDRSGQAVHPSVVDFKMEYGLETWGGFRYWMALTPFPFFRSDLENPSLLVSKDGLRWTNPPGIKNPLAPRPFGLINRNYNSDPELLYDPAQNMLILYWREYSQGVFEKIWAKKIGSNHKQSNKILCFEKKWDHKTGLVLSPTVWRKSAKEWYMWTTDGNVTMHSYTSRDGFTWSSPQPCSAPWDTWNGGYVPWHIAAKPNQAGQTVEFLIAGWPRAKSINNCELFYATAPMSEPANLSMPVLQPLLKFGVGNRWDNGYIYRSSFVLEPGDSPKIRVWYSACSKKKIWHIGYTEGRLARTTSPYV